MLVPGVLEKGLEILGSVAAVAETTQYPKVVIMADFRAIQQTHQATCEGSRKKCKQE